MTHEPNGKTQSFNGNSETIFDPPYKTEKKGNILEISKEENGKVMKAGLYLFNEQDAIEQSNFQDEKYSSEEKFIELTAGIPDRFVIK